MVAYVWFWFGVCWFFFKTNPQALLQIRPSLYQTAPGDFTSPSSFPSTSASQNYSRIHLPNTLQSMGQPRACPNLKHRRQQHTVVYYNTERRTLWHTSLTELTNLPTFPQATHPSSPNPSHTPSPHGDCSHSLKTFSIQSSQMVFPSKTGLYYIISTCLSARW